jgi:hypothetical protein
MIKYVKPTRKFAKRVTKRLSRSSAPMYKNLSSGTYMNCAVERSDSIGIALSEDKMKFSSGLTYNTVLNLIQSSQSFIDNIGLYVRYKITGLLISVHRVCAESQTVNLFGATAYSLAPLYVAVYPQLNGTDVLQSPQSKDDCMEISPFDTKTHKYYSFRETSVTGAQGLGTWNSSVNYLNQIGQVAIADLNGIATKQLIPWIITYKVYMTFNQLNR